MNHKTHWNSFEAHQRGFQFGFKKADPYHMDAALSNMRRTMATEYDRWVYNECKQIMYEIWEEHDAQYKS